ncbi:MAG: hypothetical protein Q8N06_00560 [Hydrogenophaga sp.]|nr:hypothetical protein [Hydrogenophaga sp.]
MNSSSIDTGYGGGMFDALLALSRSVRLLIAGPLIVAAVVVGALVALPSHYASHSLMALPKPPSGETAGLLLGAGGGVAVPTALQTATMMKSAVVLDQVFSALNPGSVPDDAARDALSKSVKTSVVKDGLLRLEVTSATPGDAQKIANLVIDAWLRTTKPAAQQQAELEKRLAHARQTLVTTQGILASQKNALMSMAGLGDLLDRYFAQTIEIERQMNGLTRDVVVQAPTLATRPIEPPYIVIFFQVMFGAELFFVMWVLGRRALQVANANPETAQKLEALRGSLGGVRGKENPV